MANLTPSLTESADGSTVVADSFYADDLTPDAIAAGFSNPQNVSFATGDGENVRFVVDKGGDIYILPALDPVTPPVLSASAHTGGVPANTWLYAYTLHDLVTGGDTALSVSASITTTEDSAVLVTLPDFPVWSNHAKVFRSLGGVNWRRVSTSLSSPSFSDTNPAATDPDLNGAGENSTLGTAYCAVSSPTGDFTIATNGNATFAVLQLNGDLILPSGRIPATPVALVASRADQQAQIDEIVTRMVAMGLATDSRTA